MENTQTKELIESFQLTSLVFRLFDDGKGTYSFTGRCAKPSLQGTGHAPNAVGGGYTGPRGFTFDITAVEAASSFDLNGSFNFDNIQDAYDMMHLTLSKNGHDFTNLMGVAIRDTDYPPPGHAKFLGHDISGKFIVTVLALKRTGGNYFSADIELRCIDGSYDSIGAALEFDTLNNIYSLVLHVSKVNTPQNADLKFSISDVPLDNFPHGLPVVVTEGDINATIWEYIDLKKMLIGI